MSVVTGVPTLSTKTGEKDGAPGSHTETPRWFH